MPERKTGSAPDPSAHPPKVWETGESLDESRIPGTRRLWLAGALLVAVLASTVTAVTVLEDGKDTSAKDQKQNTTSAADEPVTPRAPAATAPSGKSGLAAPEASEEKTDGKSSAPEDKQQGGAKPDPVPRPSKSASPKPSNPLKSVRAVNYPDRYWHLSYDSVRLDQVSSHSSSRTRQEASFKVVPGIADSSCVSFSLGDKRYLRHQNFRLRADRHDGSEYFKQDATFCPRPSVHSGAVALESYNFRGRFLRHRNFELRLDPAEYNQLYLADSAFRLVKGLS
ncbi:AbfB domain-containing protein [Streptomyces sp. BV286]|uniref:AbfB domain-containing protein n=1 Tax=Streptomyces sp. BV286 TaxID=2849672 RepID=UPI001C2EA11A|nr:AbfB domain-containing protein [Streptomyces sp. BV286]MBV1942977.1 AbfB domain-containing protein [Streptomyces sp. BV286]